MGQLLSEYESEARRLAENRIEPSRVASDGRAAATAALAVWIGGVIMAAREQNLENHDPGDEDRR